MNEFKFDLSFRIRHPNIDAKKICEQLGLKAKHLWTAGERRKTPKGDPLEGFYSETYCSFHLEHNEKIGLAELIKVTNKRLNAHAKFLQLVSSTGGKLEYFIGWYSDGNSGEEFDAGLMDELAKLRIGLSFDFYGGK